MSFNDLKRNSANSFEKLNQELTKLNSNQSNSRDERLWTCATDKAGNGYAIIRFLPAPGGEDVPFVRLFTHGFKGPGGWYIENSLTTIGIHSTCGLVLTSSLRFVSSRVTRTMISLSLIQLHLCLMTMMHWKQSGSRNTLLRSSWIPRTSVPMTN